MKNFERYKTTNAKNYDKMGFCYLLWRKPSDRKMFPLIQSITKKNVCDVGCGTGYYSKLFLKNNNYTIGIDQNTHLSNGLDMNVIEADATGFSSETNNKKIDVVFSAWMTEYLNEEQLLSFFEESYKVLDEEGELITTVISKRGWGYLYIKLAKLIKKIGKYNYKKEKIVHLLNQAGFQNIKIISLNSWLSVPWAYLIRAKKEREINICFIAPKAYSLFTGKKYTAGLFGGGEVQLYLLAREFATKKTLDVNFIVADYGQESFEKYDGITVIKSFRFSDPSLIKNIRFLTCFMRVNSDVYIQRALDPASGMIAVLCKLLRKRFIYMVAHNRETDGGYEKNEGMLKALLANIVFKYAEVIIVQNTIQKDLVYKNKRRDSILIKSGYYINDFKTRKDDYILWVGRSEQWKQPELFIRLAKLNMGFRFKMICPQAFNNRGFRYSSLKKKVLGVENLEFIEYVPFDEIDEYFQKAKIFVNTSTKEGFPNTFVQAAKNSTPIISLNVNPDNFLNEYNCGFFCNNDFNELNNELNRILSDGDLYNRMSDNACNYAKENHDMEKNAEELYRLIMDLKC